MFHMVSSNSRKINVWKLVGQIWAYYQKIKKKRERKKSIAVQR